MYRINYSTNKQSFLSSSAKPDQLSAGCTGQLGGPSPPVFCVWVSMSGAQSVAVPHKDATLGQALWVSAVPVHICESRWNDGTREARTSEACEVPLWHVR